MWVVFAVCSAKATHIFSAKNIRLLYTDSAKTVNEMTLNELVKLTMLWTTGPRASDKRSMQKIIFLFCYSPQNHTLWVLVSGTPSSHFQYHNLYFCGKIRKIFILLGPFVQSIVSIMSLLVVKMLTVLVSTVCNSQIFLLKKMWVTFANAKATHFFSAKILAYLSYLMIKCLTIR